MKGALCEEIRRYITLADPNAVSTGSENDEAIQRLRPASSAEHRVTPAAVRSSASAGADAHAGTGRAGTMYLRTTFRDIRIAR